MPKVDYILEDFLFPPLDDCLHSFSFFQLVFVSLGKTLWCLWAQCLDSACFIYLNLSSRHHFQLILRCHFAGIAHRYSVMFQLFHCSLPYQTVKQLLCHLMLCLQKQPHIYMSSWNIFHFDIYFFLLWIWFSSELLSVFTQLCVHALRSHVHPLICSCLYSLETSSNFS